MLKESRFKDHILYDPGYGKTIGQWQEVGRETIRGHEGILGITEQLCIMIMVVIMWLCILGLISLKGEFLLY